MAFQASPAPSLPLVPGRSVHPGGPSLPRISCIWFRTSWSCRRTLASFSRPSRWRSRAWRRTSRLRPSMSWTRDTERDACASETFSSLRSACFRRSMNRRDSSSWKSTRSSGSRPRLMDWRSSARFITSSCRMARLWCRARIRATLRLSLSLRCSRDRTFCTSFSMRPRASVIWACWTCMTFCSCSAPSTGSGLRTVCRPRSNTKLMAFSHFFSSMPRGQEWSFNSRSLYRTAVNLQCSFNTGAAIEAPKPCGASPTRARASFAVCSSTA
mmetsp:Transcript_17455/g.50995  ORF Transcript_17455/g.50995 Transcript_17455/m.50995 type:complete len:270 (+) Transcript_17455:130-939(+)